jgi:hypothetical protein
MNGRQPNKGATDGVNRMPAAMILPRWDFTLAGGFFFQ